MSTAAHHRKARSNQAQQKVHGDVGAQRATCIDSSAMGMPIYDDDDDDDVIECKEETGAAGKDWINEVSSGIRHYLDQMYEHRTNTVFNRQDIETSKQWRSVIASIIEEHKTVKKYDIGSRPLIYDAAPPDHTTLHGFKVVEGKDGRRRLALTSLFEGGNLGFATAETSDEYRLCLDFDVNSNGYTQWFYFACKGRPGDIKKGRKVTFKIENISKPASLFDNDMVPVVWSVKENTGWHHGCENIRTYRNEHSKRKGETYHTLKFTYTFQHDNDVVFFAFHYPYTYSYLQDFLARIEADSYRREWVKRRSLCSTISGLRTDVLTIANFKASDVYTDTDATGERLRRKRPVCVITARVHPGESNSSFMMHGFLTFLTGSSPQARVLRDKMIWMVVPMLNPDGVVQGNTRCNLAGVDLNRMYANPSRYLQPTIFFLKNMMRQTLLEGRQIKFFIDLHGHSKRKGIFAYGNHYTHDPQLNSMIRLFPKLCALASDDFVYNNCSFDMLSQKDGTGRVITFREMDVLNSYTIEASFWSYDRAKLSEDNDDKNMVGAFYSDMDNKEDGSSARGSTMLQRRRSATTQCADKAKAHAFTANMEFDGQQQRLREQEADRRVQSRRVSVCSGVEDDTTVGSPREDNAGDPQNAIDVLKRRLEDIAQQVGRSVQEHDKSCLPNNIPARNAFTRAGSGFRRGTTVQLSLPATTKKKECASSSEATLSLEKASQHNGIGLAAATEGESIGVFSWRRLCTNGAVLGRAIVAYLDLTETAMALDSTSTEVARSHPPKVTLPRYKKCVCCTADAVEDEVYELNGGEAQLPYLTYARLESKTVEQLVHRIMVGRSQSRALVADTNSGSESDPEADKLDDKELDKIHKRIFTKLSSLEKRRRGMLVAHKDEKLIVAFGRSERASIKGEFYRRVMAWASMPKFVDQLRKKLQRERRQKMRDRTVQGPRAQAQAQRGILKSSVLYDFVNEGNEDESDEDSSDAYSSKADEDMEVTAEETQQLAQLVEQCQQQRVMLSLYRKAEDALALPFTVPWVHRLQGRCENANTMTAVPLKSNSHGVAQAFGKCARATDTPGRCALAAFKPHKSLRGQVMNATREERAKLKMENEIYWNTLTRESGMGQNENLQIVPARPESAHSVARPPGTTHMNIPKLNGRDDGLRTEDIACPSPISGRRGSFGSSRRSSFSTNGREGHDSKIVSRIMIHESDRRLHVYDRAHGVNRHIIGRTGLGRRKSEGGSPAGHMYIQVGALTGEGPVFVDDIGEGGLAISNPMRAIPYYTHTKLIRSIEGYTWTTPGYQIPHNTPRSTRHDATEHHDGTGGGGLPPGVSIVIADDVPCISTFHSGKSASPSPVKSELRGTMSPARRASAILMRRSSRGSDGSAVEYVAGYASRGQDPMLPPLGSFSNHVCASMTPCGLGCMASILEEDADFPTVRTEEKSAQQGPSDRHISVRHAPDTAIESRNSCGVPTAELLRSPSTFRRSTGNVVDEKSPSRASDAPRFRTITPRRSCRLLHGRQRFSQSDNNENDYFVDEDVDTDGTCEKSQRAPSVGTIVTPRAGAASPRYQHLAAKSSDERPSSTERLLSGVRVPFATSDIIFDDDAGRPISAKPHLNKARRYSFDCHLSGFDSDRRPITAECHPRKVQQYLIGRRMSGNDGRPSTTEREISGVSQYSSDSLMSGFNDDKQPSSKERRLSWILRHRYTTDNVMSDFDDKRQVTTEGRSPWANRLRRISLKSHTTPEFGCVASQETTCLTSPTSATERIRPPYASSKNRIIRGTAVRKTGPMIDYKNGNEEQGCGPGDGADERLDAVGRRFSMQTPRASKGAVDVKRIGKENAESGCDRRDSLSYYLMWRKDST